MRPSIRPRSQKRAKQEREYAKLREQFLFSKVCQVCMSESCSPKWTGQLQMATDVHHKKGRIGALLTDTNYWLAVCRYHHKKIEENPVWAKSMGFSLSRLAS